MRHVFGAGLTIWRLDLSTEVPEVQEGPLLQAPVVHEAPLLAPVVHAAPLGETRAVVRKGAIAPLTVAGRTYREETPVTLAEPVNLKIAASRRLLPIPPLTLSQRTERTVRFETRVRDMPELPAPRVKHDLAFMRRRPMLKRAVPSRFLTDAQIKHWQQRMSNAKRVTPRLIEIVSIFPNVPLLEDTPVQFNMQEAAIAFPLTEHPVPLTTVVVARHQTTGQVLIGRFMT